MTTKLAALLLCLASTASAETKSWSTVKAHLGASAQVIISVDVDSLRKSGSLPGVLEAVTSDSPQAPAMLAMIKSTCQIDPTAVVSDMTLAFAGDDDVFLAVGFTGVDQTKVLDCATKVVAAQKSKLTASTAGKVTAYSVDGKEVIAGAWIAKDLFVMSSKIMGKSTESHAVVEAFLAGKPVAGDITKYLGKADVTKPLWFAVANPGKDVLGAYGTVGFASAKIDGTAKIITKSKDIAGKITGDTKDKLARRAKSTNDADVAKVLNAVKVVSTTADVDVTVSVPDKDAKSAFKAFDKMF